MWYIYLLECSDKTIYTGITTDLNRRVKEHNESSKGAKYTRGRRPVKLIKSFEVIDRSAASKLEYKIKQLSKTEKLNMINSMEISSSTVLIGKKILNRLRLTPRMCASVKEAYVVQVTTVLTMLQVDYDLQNFCAKHLETDGCAYKNCLEPVDDEWAHAVIDAALKLIDNNVQG